MLHEICATIASTRRGIHAMKTLSLSAILPDGFAALTTALSDPGVERIARSMNLDLEDPATLNELLTLTQKYVDSASQVGAVEIQMLSQELVRDQSRFVRAAIRTYLQIAAMTY